MKSWKREFALVWISQFISVAGFAFCLPFAPFYIQELGVTDPVKLKVWVSIFAAVTPLSLAVFAPIWGAVADRYGRRLMLLRANLSAAIILALMGVTDSVIVLVGLRFLQGMLTGTVTAAQAMVSAQTPEHRSGLVLGTLSAAMFSGAMAGALAGGVFAHTFGYRLTFVAAGALLLVATLLVLFGTREEFVRPTEKEIEALERDRPPLGRLHGVFPILCLITAMATARQFDLAMLPLLVQEIHGTADGVSLWTGGLFAVGGVAGLLAGVLLGHLSDRMNAARIGQWAALGAGLLMIPQGLAHSFLPLFLSRLGMLFCAGGLDPVLQIWLAKTTPVHRRGMIFGWAGTARSIGWVIAPLVSGALASLVSVRFIYFASSLLFVALIPFIGAIVRRSPAGG
jgi:DHA1 family multidrug resistance protein-like MFS transporter